VKWLQDKQISVGALELILVENCLELLPSDPTIATSLGAPCADSRQNLFSSCLFVSLSLFSTHFFCLFLLLSFFRFTHLPCYSHLACEDETTNAPIAFRGNRFDTMLKIQESVWE
jgi:hypothetical protein